MLERILMLVILASGMCSAIMYSAITPVLPGLASHFGGGEQGSFLAQMVMTMPGLGMMIGGPLAGVLIERLGERRVILASILAFAVTGSAGLYLSDSSTLLASRLLVGIAASSFTTACLTLMSWRFSLTVRMRLLGYQSALGAGMGLLSLLAAGLAADLGSWRTPFAFHLLSLLAFVLAVWVLPRERAPESQIGKAKGSLKALTPIYLGCIPLFIAVFTTSVQAPFLLETLGIESAGVQSRVLALGVLGHAVGAWLFSRLTGWFGVVGNLILGLSLMSAGHLLLGLAAQPFSVALACLIISLGSGTLVPHMTHRIVERTAVELRGRALGLFPVFTFLGSLLNPLAYSPLISVLGMSGALLVAAALLGVCALSFAGRIGYGRLIKPA